MDNKPSWENAPFWASYLAMDANGDWWWYENEPEPEDDTWAVFENGGAIELAVAFEFPNWQCTLEQRP